MTIRIPDLRTQANLLGDALKGELGAPNAQRTKVLDLVAQINGLHSWQHAVALGKATAEDLAPALYFPTPWWVDDLAKLDLGWFDELTTAARRAMYAQIANAGFSPLVDSGSLVEFRRKIAPNAIQALIPEHYPEQASEHPFAFCTTEFGCDDEDSWDARIDLGSSWEVALRLGLQRAEEERILALNYPDAWTPGLTGKLFEMGIDWAKTDWRALAEIPA